MDYIFIWVIIWFICAFASGRIASSKGRSYGEGFVIGLLLGFIGVIIVAVLPANVQSLEDKHIAEGTGKKCPFCAEIIKQEAIVCRYCGRELPGMQVKPGSLHVSRYEFSKLTYRQQYAVREYGYLLNPHQAEIVGEMMSKFKDKEAMAFAQRYGKKVTGYIE